MAKTEKRGWFAATLLGFGLTAAGVIESLLRRPTRDPNRKEELIHTDVMFEARDVNARVIGWVAVGVLVSAVLIHAIVGAVYAYFIRTEFRNRQPVTLVQQSARPPAVPLLQQNPAGDLERLQASQQTILNSYGWVDQQQGTVHIPIDEAMKRVLEKGLPPAEKASPSPVSGSATK
jgi:hypothetical protein